MITFEQIIYIDFQGKNIGKIIEVNLGDGGIHYDIYWENDKPFPTPIVFGSVEDAKAEALKTFKDHL